jgi:hypothetical protein
MPKAKDKAFHADGSMTAAEYKRRFLNKKAVARASSQVEVRTNMGRMSATKADKARLRNVHIRSEPMPGDFYSPRQERAARNGVALAQLKPGANQRHISTRI